MIGLDEQVRKALENVPRAYDDFVSIWKDFRGRPEEQRKLLDFIKKHPEANAGVVLEEIVFKILPELLESDDDEEN